MKRGKERNTHLSILAAQPPPPDSQLENEKESRRSTEGMKKLGRPEERGKRFLTTIKLSSRSQLDLNMSLTPSLIQCFIYGMGCFFLVEARFAVTNQLEATSPAKIKKCEERISKYGRKKISFVPFSLRPKNACSTGLFQNPYEIH